MVLDIIFIVCALLLSFVFTYVVIKICDKKKLYDEVNARKVHEGNIPRLGGIAVFSVFYILSIVYCLIHRDLFDYTFLFVFIGGFVIFLAGVLDDLFDFRAKLKFLIQIVVALGVVISPYNFTAVLSLDIPIVMGKIITFMWILFGVNAYNLIDGLDWLCSGLSFLALIPIVIIAMSQNYMIGMLSCILCGSILGFMIWNKPKAKIFLGDGGSQTLGFFVSVLPLMLSTDGFFNDTKIFYALCLTSIPFIDVIAAVIRRVRDHRRIFSADRAHVHHKLLNIGLPQLGALAVIFGFQLFIDSIVVTAYIMNTKLSYILLIVAYIVIIIAFCVLHYINRHVNRLHKGKLDSAPQKEH